MVPVKKVQAKSQKVSKDFKVLLSNVKIETLSHTVEPFDILEFKKSVVYKSIEQASIIGDGLEFRTEEQEDRKLIDLDSHSSTQVC